MSNEEVLRRTGTTKALLLTASKRVANSGIHNEEREKNIKSKDNDGLFYDLS